MNAFSAIYDLIDVTNECLRESDWDRLAAVVSPSLVMPDDATVGQIETALAAVEELQARLQEQLNAIGGELESVPTVRRAVRAYLRS